MCVPDSNISNQQLIIASVLQHALLRSHSLRFAAAHSAHESALLSSHCGPGCSVLQNGTQMCPCQEIFGWLCVECGEKIRKAPTTDFCFRPIVFGSDVFHFDKLYANVMLDNINCFSTIH